MSVLATKRELVDAGLRILTANLPKSINTDTSTEDVNASLENYDFIVGQELESYLYQFSITPLLLSNPVDPDPDIVVSDESYEYYTKPNNTGEIFGIFTKDSLNSVIQKLSRQNKDNLGSMQYSSYRTQVQVPKVEEDLYLVYTNTQPEPSTMSVSFQNGVRFAIAAVASFYYQYHRRQRQDLVYESKLNFQKARIYDWYSINKNDGHKDTLDDIIHRGLPSGKSYAGLSNSNDVYPFYY